MYPARSFAICLCMFNFYILSYGNSEKGFCLKSCQDEWEISDVSNQCFYYDTFINVTFFEAIQACLKFHPRARIVSANSERSVKHLNQNGLTTPFWIGLMRHVAKGKEFNDMDGELVFRCKEIKACHPFEYGPDYMPWGYQEPSGTLYEDCIYVQNGLFYAANCRDKKALYCSINHCGTPIGESCEEDYKCVRRTKRSICKANVCSCPDLQFEAEDECLPSKNLGEKCKFDKECNTRSNTSECRDRVCSCVDEYYLSNTTTIATCTKKYDIGLSCTQDDECLTNVCKGNICNCRNDRYQNLTDCIDKKILHDICTFDGQCMSGKCTATKCVCQEDYFEEHETCIKNLWIDMECHNDTVCVKNFQYTFCDMEKNKCKCHIIYYMEDNRCILKKQLKSKCMLNEECLSDYCEKMECKCSHGYFVYERNCVEGLRYGQACTENIECSSYDVNAVCNNVTCTCTNSFGMGDDEECIPDFNEKSDCKLKVEIFIKELSSLAANHYRDMSAMYPVFKLIENKVYSIYHDSFHKSFLSVILQRVVEPDPLVLLLYLTDTKAITTKNLKEQLIEKFQIQLPKIGQWISLKQAQVFISTEKGSCPKLETPTYKISTYFVIAILLILSFCGIGAMIYVRKYKLINPRDLVPWKQKEYRMPYVPDSWGELNRVCYLITFPFSNEFCAKDMFKNNPINKNFLIRRYLHYFYNEYYDFDYTYTYDFNYDYEGTVDLTKPAPDRYYEDDFTISDDYYNYGYNNPYSIYTDYSHYYNKASL